ncbi:hypothetical protein CASFOL_041870 [Castilleja foliolosa]|uniref:Uncharacterized protein n=1 Tax=Castilleja foliolosa TaxID=1961234 RepID=A0ABD3B9K5_9LAMI
MSYPGSKQSNLKKSFNRAMRSLLSACSDEDFRKAFPSLTEAERTLQHRCFVRVINSLHEDIEEELESILLETQAGTILDNVEELVKEHEMDPLISKKSNVGETVQSLSEVKKNELKHLKELLGKAEEHNRKTKERLEVLEKEKQDFSGAVNLVDELRSTISNYEKGYRRTKLIDL